MSLEFVAVILASSSGSRLYPLTVDAHDGRALDSDEEQDEKDDKEEEQGSKSADTAAAPFMPKHLLPVAGSPNIFHLLRRLHACHFSLVILTLSAHDPDTLTLRVLTEPSLGFGAIMTQTLADGNVMLNYHGMKIHMVRLVGECSGSADVLRILSCKINTATTTTANTTSTTDAATHVLPHNAHVMVLPGDLIVTPSSSALEMEDEDPIVLLADAHRKGAFPIHFSQYSTMKNGTSAALPSSPPPPTAAMTMLLTNVGEEDETATPLKESAKAKKGGLAREDLDIEYIALSHIQHLHHIHTLTAAASATIVNSFASSSSSSSSSLSSRAIASSSFAPIPSFATRAVPQRVILKTSKFAIEEDEENTGSTPKLIIPKARFHPTTIFHDMAPSAKSSFSIRNDWSDIHAYVFSPWVLHLLQARPAIKDIQKDLVPLLIARQFKGVKATFLGTQASSSHTFTTATTTTTTTTTTMETLVDKEDRKTILDHVLVQDPTFQSHHYSISIDERNQQLNHHRNSINTLHSTSSLATTMTSMPPPLTTTTCTTTTPFTDRGQKQTSNPTRDEQQSHSVDFPYLVNAQVLPRSTSKLTLRACTIPSYLYACREMASRACTTPEHVVNKKNPTATSSSIPFANLPHGTVIDTKTHSILLPDASMEDKVQIKSCTVGHRSKIGSKSRLNNVVIMDDVVIGENCVLQNSVISSHCVIGENSNLNDCQVGPKAVVPSGTKAKGESFTV